MVIFKGFNELIQCSKSFLLLFVSFKCHFLDFVFLVFLNELKQRTRNVESKLKPDELETYYGMNIIELCYNS